MSEIIILDEMPVVLTKQTNWGEDVIAIPGAIIRLPEDAVLVSIPVKEKVDEN